VAAAVDDGRIEFVREEALYPLVEKLTKLEENK
jgi:hypothetical protein